jgi:hypothetical protein
MLLVYGHDRCPLECDETTSTDPEVIITLSEKPRPRANLDDILVVEHQNPVQTDQRSRTGEPLHRLAPVPVSHLTG